MSLILIDSIPISNDPVGRFCLNDLHRAAGGENRHRPSIWVQNTQTRALIDEASKAGIPALKVIKGGNSPGTYVTKELVYAYAMWISPEFNLKVIRTFDAVMTAPAVPTFHIPQTMPEALRLAADYAEKNQQLEHQIVADAPKVKFAESRDSVTISNFAKVLNLGPNQLFDWLRERGALMTGGNRHNMPKQEYITRGYFVVRENTYEKYGTQRLSFTTLITGKGQRWIVAQLRHVGMIKDGVPV